MAILGQLKDVHPGCFVGEVKGYDILAVHSSVHCYLLSSYVGQANLLHICTHW